MKVNVSMAYGGTIIQVSPHMEVPGMLGERDYIILHIVFVFLFVVSHQENAYSTSL